MYDALALGVLSSEFEQAAVNLKFVERECKVSRYNLPFGWQLIALGMQAPL